MDACGSSVHTNGINLGDLAWAGSQLAVLAILLAYASKYRFPRMSKHLAKDEIPAMTLVATPSIPVFLEPTLQSITETAIFPLPVYLATIDAPVEEAALPHSFIGLLPFLFHFGCLIGPSAFAAAITTCRITQHNFAYLAQVATYCTHAIVNAVVAHYQTVAQRSAGLLGWKLQICRQLFDGQIHHQIPTENRKAESDDLFQHGQPSVMSQSRHGPSSQMKVSGASSARSNPSPPRIWFNPICVEVPRPLYAHDSPGRTAIKVGVATLLTSGQPRSRQVQAALMSLPYPVGTIADCHTVLQHLGGGKSPGRRDARLTKLELDTRKLALPEHLDLAISDATRVHLFSSQHPLDLASRTMAQAVAAEKFISGVPIQTNLSVPLLVYQKALDERRVQLPVVDKAFVDAAIRDRQFPRDSNLDYQALFLQVWGYCIALIDDPEAMRLGRAYFDLLREQQYSDIPFQQGRANALRKQFDSPATTNE